MPGKGRTFRRKTAKFWSIWPLPPKVEEVHDVVYLDGIYLARNLCVLICCNDTHVLGWYVCRYEHAKALFNVKTMDQAFIWINELSAWRMTYSDFLREMTIDEFGNKRSTHERLLKAESSIWRMIRQQTLFTFLEYIDITVPTTNNRIESGVKSHTLFVL